ncbi:MAG: N4-gp56 family major capsid protein [Eubacteriales bacterium]|nr:N4-gp56 family major capsid protein [Eubacteriales bacterium]
MAINLHDKFAKKMLDAFTADSFTEGLCGAKYDFIGVKSIKIMTTVTDELNDYSRSGTSRYGTPTDVQDTLQELTMTQDKSFTKAIDKGDNSEQDMMKNAAVYLRKQIRERVTPAMDKYRLSLWAMHAGKIATMASAPTAATIVGALLDAEVYFADNLVPADSRCVWIPHKYVKFLKTASEWTGCDGIVNKILFKGEVGTFSTLHIVAVPESYMPANVYFLCAQKESLLGPKKLAETQVHQNPPGISGHLIEGRWIYDAFVLGEIASGVYACIAAANKSANPTVNASTGAIALGTNNTAAYYTLDGTDPRYSTTAVKITAGATPSGVAGKTVKVVAERGAGYFSSDVVTQDVAAS